jgi:MFS family permease
MCIRGDDLVSEEEPAEEVPRVHPLRMAAVYIIAPTTIMDTFLLLFTTTLLAEKLGAGILLGFIVPAYTGMNVLTANLWGWMADKYGRRPPLIIGSLFTVSGCVLFAFATEPWHLIAASAIRGIGGAADVPITRAIAADLAPRKVLGERMGAFSMAMYAAPLIGISISGPLYQMDWRLPFLAAAFTEFVDFLLVLFAVPETLVKKGRPRSAEEAKPYRMERFKRGAREWYLILKRRGVALFILTVLVGAFVGRGISTLAYPLFAKQFGLSETQISIVYVIGMIISIMGLTPGGRISDRIGRKFPILFQGYYGAITTFLYTFIPAMATAGMAFQGFLLISIVGSASVIVGGPAFTAYFYEWVTLKERGRASAMSNFFDDLGVTFGFPLVAGIYKLVSPLHLFYFGAVVSIVVTSIIWIFWKDPPPREELGK